MFANNLYIKVPCYVLLSIEQNKGNDINCSTHQKYRVTLVLYFVRTVDVGMTYNDFIGYWVTNYHDLPTTAFEFAVNLDIFGDGVIDLYDVNIHLFKYDANPGN